MAMTWRVSRQIIILAIINRLWIDFSVAVLCDAEDTAIHLYITG